MKKVKVVELPRSEDGKTVSWRSYAPKKMYTPVTLMFCLFVILETESKSNAQYFMDTFIWYDYS